MIRKIGGAKLEFMTNPLKLFPAKSVDSEGRYSANRRTDGRTLTQNKKARFSEKRAKNIDLFSKCC